MSFSPPGWAAHTTPKPPFPITPIYSSNPPPPTHTHTTTTKPQGSNAIANGGALHLTFITLPPPPTLPHPLPLSSSRRPGGGPALITWSAHPICRCFNNFHFPLVCTLIQCSISRSRFSRRGPEAAAGRARYRAAPGSLRCRPGM